MTADAPPAAIAGMLRAARAISLADLEREAALQTRVDRKYVVDWETLTAVLTALVPGHRVLEIAGRRWFAYETTYFDTERLTALRAHVQGRRRRFKVRTRRYLDSDAQLLEVKLKGRRGETIKRRLAYDTAHPAAITDGGRAFLEAAVADAYPDLGVPELRAVLRNRYRRITLAGGAQRLTIDFGLAFELDGAWVPGLDPGHVIVESKSLRGTGAADRALRNLHVRPVACSKYCVGMSLTRPDVHAHAVVGPLRRWLPETAHA